jgi:DNA-binding GntR family transcriptional regulator
LCEIATPAQIAQLEAHVEKERAARAAGDTRATIRLSGGFHLVIGELAGSSYLWDVLRDLVSRTSLIMAMYQSRSQVDCGPDEHAEVVEAIRSANADRAQQLMDHHLDHLEGKLDLEESSSETDDLRDILS